MEISVDFPDFDPHDEDHDKNKVRCLGERHVSRALIGRSNNVGPLFTGC